MLEERERSNRANLINRMIGAAWLQVNTFEDVEADRSATRQAVVVVTLVAIATGIGSIDVGIGQFFFGVVIGLAGWAIWAWITYVVGTKDVIPRDNKQMWKWRKALFVFLQRNDASATGFFQIPPNKVIEIGSQMGF